MDDEPDAQVSDVVDTSSEPEHGGQNNNQRPAGYDPVDLSELPPEKQKEIDDRIRYLYKQVKDNERYRNEYKSIASEQAAQIADLMSGVGQVVDHLHTQTAAQTEAQIKYSMRTALESGDIDTYLSEQEKLVDLKAEQKFSKLKAEKEPKRQSNPQTPSIYEIGEEAVGEGDITPQELEVVNVWQDERDQSGRPLRPWAVNASRDPQRPDPQYVRGLRETMAVFTNPQYKNMTVDQKLSEVDRRMGVQKQAPAQNVMGGNLTTRGKMSKITMTPKQQEIAVRTKFGGPKAKSDADHIEAFRKQIEQAQSSRRSR